MARRRMTVATVVLIVLVALGVPGSVMARRSSASRRARLAAPGASLAGCSSEPNCVSTEAPDALHRIAPVPFADEPGAALDRARAALHAEPGARVVLERPGYLRAEMRSRAFRFVDDVEIAVDPVSRAFRMRSAARLGRRDFGVNRKRMARLGALLRSPGS